MLYNLSTFSVTSKNDAFRLYKKIIFPAYISEPFRPYIDQIVQ